MKTEQSSGAQACSEHAESLLAAQEPPHLRAKLGSSEVNRAKQSYNSMMPPGDALCSSMTGMG